MSTPADANSTFNRDDCPSLAPKKKVRLKPLDYRDNFGCCLYIAKQTRPDILATVVKLSRFLDNPGKAHWKAAKRALRYLKGTRQLELAYRKHDADLELTGACDADWASDTDDRRSTTGFAFSLHAEGSSISWNSKKQQTAAISTCEAEYQAMAAAVQEVLYLRSLLCEMGISNNSPTTILEDNQSCIKMCRNPVMQKRTKHIDVKYHFIRERVEDSTVKLEYCQTDEMYADILTKPLTRPKVEKHRTVLLGCSLDSHGSTA